MILQRLNELYSRLLADGEVEAPGFQAKEILWVVTLTAEGECAGLTATGDGKARGAKFSVPAEVKKSVNIAANLLWDNPEYVFGVARAGATAKQAAKVPERHAAFLERLRALPEEAQADPGLRAVRTFLEAGDFTALQANDRWADLAGGGANVSFRLRGETGLICGRPAIRAAIAAQSLDGEEGDDRPWCLVTGDRTVSARLHPSIKGVVGGQSSGTSLVAFNLAASESHGWTQGDNAPVGRSAAMAYAAALNYLLARDHDTVTSHREGETTFLFWAAERHAIERVFAETLGEHAVAAPDDDGVAMAQTLASVRRGLVSQEEDRTGFFVLAVTPNAARLAVRSWHPTTVGEMARRFRAHFDALDLVGLDRQPFPALWRLLATIAPGGDLKRLSDSLRGRLSDELVRAILDGTPYPATLLSRAVERCRLENAVRPLRAALIKAVLSRRPSSSDTPARELTVSLDPTNTNPGYRLGRLFSVLEYLQFKAQGELNTTIRDRYFGAAMTSPRAVFVQLERLKAAHLKKLRRDMPGLAMRLEREVEEILSGLRAGDGLPAALSLDDQGRFILGYHHQRHDHAVVPSDTEATDTQGDRLS